MNSYFQVTIHSAFATLIAMVGSSLSVITIFMGVAFATPFLKRGYYTTFEGHRIFIVGDSFYWVTVLLLVTASVIATLMIGRHWRKLPERR